MPSALGRPNLGTTVWFCSEFGRSELHSRGRRRQRVQNAQRQCQRCRENKLNKLPPHEAEGFCGSTGRRRDGVRTRHTAAVLPDSSPGPLQAVRPRITLGAPAAGGGSTKSGPSRAVTEPRAPRKTPQGPAESCRVPHPPTAEPARRTRTDPPPRNPAARGAACPAGAVRGGAGCGRCRAPAADLHSTAAFPQRPPMGGGGAGRGGRSAVPGAFFALLHAARRVLPTERAEFGASCPARPARSSASGGCTAPHALPASARLCPHRTQVRRGVHALSLPPAAVLIVPRCRCRRCRRRAGAAADTRPNGGSCGRIAPPRGRERERSESGGPARGPQPAPLSSERG